jgi:conjugal transfer pilus assembly protein TraF
VRENLPKYKDAAWDNPTVENVRAFMYLQRFAIDRSEQFSNATEMAVLGDPYLDEISRRPAATFASQKLDVEAGKEKSASSTLLLNVLASFSFLKTTNIATFKPLL